MKIKYGPDELDLDTISSVSDLISFVEHIKPQKESLFPPDKVKQRKNEILFDECTEKETALRNLAFVLQEEGRKLQRRMFPSEVSNLILLAKQTGKTDLVTIPPVDTEEYATLQKISYTQAFVTNYVATLIQSRVGFGLNLSINPNGQIYCLTDLRELHSASV